MSSPTKRAKDPRPSISWYRANRGCPQAEEPRFFLQTGGCALRRAGVRCGDGGLVVVPCRSVLNDAPMRAFSEPKVEPKAHQIGGQAVGGGTSQRVSLAGEIDKEVFGLDGPIWSEAHLNAGARRPADMKMALGVADDVDMAAPICEPQRAVEQDVVEGEATAPAHRPEPRIGELVIGKRVTRTGQLEITFPARHKLPELPIVSALETARDAAGLGTAVGELARLKTEVSPHIGARPIPDRRPAGRRAAGAGWRRRA